MPDHDPLEGIATEGKMARIRAGFLVQNYRDCGTTGEPTLAYVQVVGRGLHDVSRDRPLVELCITFP
jgi:hypothetical protein